MSSFQFVPRFFGLYLARDTYQQYPGFQGEIQQWYFMAGEGSWIIPGEVECEFPGGCDEPEPEDETCVILYAGCDYEGMNTRICSDTPFTDIDYEVLSIKVPEGRTIYLYNMPCFNGQNAQFTTSVNCLVGIDFSLL
jgi:hypothetical protein